MTQTVPKRNEVPVENTWDPYSVFPSDAAWEEAIGQVNDQLPHLAAFQGRLSEGPAKFLEWMGAAEAMIKILGKIYIYAGMFYQVNTADPEASAKNDRAGGLFAKALAAIAFAEPELISIGFDTLRAWMETEPRLKLYAQYFSQLERRQQHVRSAEVEAFLSEVMDVFRTGAATHSILAQAELKFKPATNEQGESLEVTNGSYYSLVTLADRQVRRTAWENFTDAHLQYQTTMANCLAAGVKQNVFTARARRYSSALQAALDETFIPETVYRNTLEAFQRNLPTWHRYWRARRRALGVEKLYPYDVAAPLTQNKPVVPFNQAMEWIEAGMQPLGTEYVEVVRRGVRQQRWLDIYPNQGKSAGAFSSGMPGTHPFILLNHNDDLFGMSVLAHELGHSLHSYFTWQTQPLVYANYGIFVAEVASNFNQALVRDYLFKNNPDRNFQIALIEEAMANFYRYFFLMPTLARFELEIHERVERGQALTAVSLNDLMADLFEEAYGGEVEIDRNRVGITWALFHTHLYSNFYVYQYATGLAGAHALAGDILAGKPGTAEKYLNFLKAGSSLYPLEVLKLAGVDMASPEPMEKTFAVLASMVERLEHLV